MFRKLFLVLPFVYFLTACNGVEEVSAAADPQKGSGCKADDPSQICLALKYVTYIDSTGAAIVSEDQAQTTVKGINDIWKQCHVSFQVEHYMAIKPADYNLAYQTSNYPELDDIRNSLGDDHTLLVTITGTWNRSGSLGKTSANAWTAMPGGGPYGAILERPVATFANIIAHELGHYLNLLHVQDTNDVMNAIIYNRSTALSDSQCETARTAVWTYWSKMTRSSN